MNSHSTPAGSRLERMLFRDIDAASLVVFRISFGIIMMVEVYRYFAHGWIERYYIGPDFHFKYFGFGWVHPWPGDGMYWHFAVLGLLAALITAGLFYRLASVLFLVGFTYVFLLDQARYLNHFYLVILVSFALCWVPANRIVSLDAGRRPAPGSRIPAWSLWLLVAQFEIVYLYAGIVKINPDWLRLQPLSTWLADRQDLPLLGAVFEQQWLVAAGAYGVIVLHVIGAPLLLFRRTRPYIFVLYLTFHLANHFTFSIGIFPWMAIAGTLIFFEPSWPRRFAAWSAERLGAPGCFPLGRVQPDSDAPTGGYRRWIVAALVLWLCFQVLFPLRHLAYPGNVAWTEEGHRFAWRMKLRDKRGSTSFFVIDPATGERWDVDTRDFLDRRQRRKMTCRPDMILQFAHHIADTWTMEYEIESPEVYASSNCSLNFRPRAPLIDPARDLAAVERSLWHADWILPLDQDFEGQ